MAHVRRDLAQAIWLLLLDEEVVDAVINGTEVELWDKSVRDAFVLFSAYISDYPEK